MSYPFKEIFTYEKLYSIILSFIVVVAIFLTERLLKRVITRFSQRAELKKHLENILALVARIVIYSTGITIILEIWGLPTEWFISVSALSGAAIGFASTQTIGNLLAGIYIMISRPFEVDDYVKIGGSEGEIREITLNYVKIYTPTYTIIKIPNRVVLNSTIHRCMSNDSIDYSFPMSFAGKVYTASWVSSTDLFKKIVEPAIEEFWARYREVLPREPEFSVSEVAFLNRTLMIRTFFPKGKAKLLYELRPELQKMLLKRLDDFRTEKGGEDGQAHR